MGVGDWPARRLAAIRLIFSRRRREMVTIALLGAVTVATLYSAFAIDPGRPEAFAQELLVSLGTSLLFGLVAYAWFDRLVQRVRESATTEWSNLDHDRLIQRMGYATRRIMIIEIWTGLLDDQRFHRDFLPMVGRALKRGVQVTIYLNHPESEVAKERSIQLAKIDVREKILLNLGRLREFAEDDENQARVRNLNVLVGHMHPDIQVYCWDDRALLTFYSTDMPTYDIPQIETHVTNTPWGVFVDKKMDALANDAQTVSLHDYLYIDIELRGIEDDGVVQPRRATRYVVSDGVFIRDRWLAENAMDSGKLVAVRFHGDSDDTFVIRRAYGEQARIARKAFREKYGMERETLFELVGLEL
ncbi:MAG TPA: hypothetical protein VF062_23185 [Candidatus Limnocylindrales bacterium]